MFLNFPFEVFFMCSYMFFFLENVTWKQIVLISIAITDQKHAIKTYSLIHILDWYPQGITCIFYHTFLQLFTTIRIEVKFVFFLCGMYTFLYNQKPCKYIFFCNLGFVECRFVFRHIKKNMYYTIQYNITQIYITQ